jgi:hypothetical protein
MYLITGVEDGWIKVDEETWNKYLEVKERFDKQNLMRQK